MGTASTTYRPRTPAEGVVYQVVRDHFETFRAQAADLREGEGLPRFVEEAAFARSAPASLRRGTPSRLREGAGLDTLACPRCGGRLRLIALVDEAAVVERILRPLHLPTEVPTPRPARAPPPPMRAAFEEDGGPSDFMPCH